MINAHIYAQNDWEMHQTQQTMNMNTRLQYVQCLKLLARQPVQAHGIRIVRHLCVSPLHGQTDVQIQVIIFCLTKRSHKPQPHTQRMMQMHGIRIVRHFCVSPSNGQTDVQIQVIILCRRSSGHQASPGKVTLPMRLP